ncbi:hypothetical protein BDF14DRAFT_1740412 [Spinellus fusiger]|nr:hypothetical protein BDF14DRAFT_1740412 [Spinellus fusiger]
MTVFLSCSLNTLLTPQVQRKTSAIESPRPHTLHLYEPTPRHTSALTHLVPPEAIRVAEQEEQDEALGSTHQPFSAYPSFLLMKHMHSPHPPAYSSDGATHLHGQEREQLPEQTQKQTRQRLKRPPNAYLLFNREMRPQLLRASPNWSFTDISKEMARQWKELQHVRHPLLEDRKGKRRKEKISLIY